MQMAPTRTPHLQFQANHILVDNHCHGMDVGSGGNLDTLDRLVRADTPCGTETGSNQLAALKNALLKSPYAPLRELAVELSGGNVTLRGAVKTYFMKQMAQETVRHFDRRLKIHNRVNVSEISRLPKKAK